MKRLNWTYLSVLIGLFLWPGPSYAQYGIFSQATKNYFSGSVGIGTSNPATTLDVNGQIRPGGATTGASCSTEGAFAYDFTAHALVYCNGSLVWATTKGQPARRVPQERLEQRERRGHRGRRARPVQ